MPLAAATLSFALRNDVRRACDAETCVPHARKQNYNGTVVVEKVGRDHIQLGAVGVSNALINTFTRQTVMNWWCAAGDKRRQELALIVLHATPSNGHIRRAIDRHRVCHYLDLRLCRAITNEAQQNAKDGADGDRHGRARDRRRELTTVEQTAQSSRLAGGARRVLSLLTRIEVCLRSCVVSCHPRSGEINVKPRRKHTPEMEKNLRSKKWYHGQGTRLLEASALGVA